MTGASRSQTLPRISAAESIMFGVLKLTFLDSFECIVDLRPVISTGEIFACLRDPAHFREVRVAEYGHAIVWTDDDGEDIDFSADSLRQLAERQAEILRLAG